MSEKKARHTCDKCGLPLEIRGCCTEMCEIKKSYEKALRNQQVKMDEVIKRNHELETEVKESREFICEMGKNEIETVTRLVRENNKMDQALHLIATPARPDGTWNRCRKACQELAKEALGIK